MGSEDHNEKTGLSEEDRALFRQAVQDSRPITHDRVNHRKTSRKISFKQDDSHNLADLHLDYSSPEEIFGAEDSLFYAQPSLQHRIIKRLKQGQYPIEAIIDLHGYDRDQANLTLQQFLQAAQQQGKRCLLVVHGKGLSNPEGGAILKNHVNHWLKNCPAVLAYCSALAKDGGRGAVYVLLKNPFKKKT